MVGMDDDDRGAYQPAVAVEPADDGGHGRVDTGNGQEEVTILSFLVIRDTENHRESSEDDKMTKKKRCLGRSEKVATSMTKKETAHGGTEES